MKNKDFITRVISGAVLVVILLIVGIFGNIPLLLFCTLVATIGMKELYSAIGIYNKNAEDKKKNIPAITGMVLCTVYFVVSGFAAPLLTMNNSYMSGAFVYVMIIFFAMALIYVFTFPEFGFKDIAYAVFGALYTPLFVTSIFLIRAQNDGTYFFWLIFISSWICDTCAYLVGCKLGKHRLAPVLSPKKSIEGAVGGLAGSVIVAFVFGYFVQYRLLGGHNYAVKYMIICLIGAAFSQVGDLFASAIKRNNDIKDYGTLIPGHGGILDRFDSVIFVSPVIYVLTSLLF